MFKFIYLLLISSWMAGCSHIYAYKAYDDINVEQSKLAKLYVPEDIEINSIDGRKGFYPHTDNYAGAVIELIAGKHVFNVEYYARNFVRQKGDTTLTFELQPQKSYFIYEENHFFNNQQHARFYFELCGGETEQNLNRIRQNASTFVVKYKPICSMQ